MTKLYNCDTCGKSPLSQDEVAATKRLLGEKSVAFLCLNCLAEEIGFDREELDAMIEQLKEEGCQYFS